MSLIRSAVRRLSAPVLRPTQAAFAPTGDEDLGTTLGQMFDQHDGRLCNKWVHYLPIYDRVLSDRRGTGVRLLELGVQEGGSLDLWRRFLGPDAVIHGLDVDPACGRLSTDDLPVHIGSQADRAVLALVVTAMGGVDVVIDDGSHVARHQRQSFDALWPSLPDGGLYIIEDTHTSYWLRHGGGFLRPGTAIQVAKSLVDGMHRWYHRAPLRSRARMARDEVGSVTFYDSIIVIEKQRRTRPAVTFRGGGQDGVSHEIVT